MLCRILSIVRGVSSLVLRGRLSIPKPAFAFTPKMGVRFRYGVKPDGRAELGENQVLPSEQSRTRLALEKWVTQTTAL